MRRVASYWREKAVSSSAIIILVLIWAPGLSQSFQSVKITYSCRSTKLETVIDHLSKATGTYFVYSPSKIEASQLVSLSVKDKALAEVLDALGRQLNLSFKSEGRHIVVKAMEPPVRPSGNLRNENNMMAAAYKPDDHPVHYAMREFSSLKPLKTVDLRSANNYLNKNQINLQPYFDTTLLKRVPTQYLRRINTSGVGTRGFVSAGLLVNDYSTGLEIQAGVPKIYAIFSPTWLRTGEFHGAYGVGSSIHLSAKISLSPVYLFASMNKILTHTVGTGNRTLDFQEKTTVDHHQVKLMAQYEVGRRLLFKVGPTINDAKTTFKSQATNPLPEQRPYFESLHIPSTPPYGTSITRADKPNTVITDSPASSVSHRVWVGWEASVSYKINFSRRK